METVANKTAKKDTKAVVNKVASTTAKEVKVSDYTTNVINSNKALKTALASVGAVRSMLLEHKDVIKLDASFVAFLELSKKDKETYEALSVATRKTKTGKVPPFYVLQALHKLTKAPTVAKVTKTTK